MAFIFLSYRPGDDGGYVEILLRELCDAVRLKADPQQEIRAYLASGEMGGGEIWPEEAVAALAECTSLVAVCSERYFLTERCGREWWTFQDRLVQHEAATGRQPKALVPLAWGGNGLHWSFPGKRFATDIGIQEDVRALSRLRTNRVRYRELIDQLAQHILDVSRADPVPRAATVLPYGDTPNAFRGTMQPGTQRPPSPVAASAPQAVKFVVAAGSREEMTGVRNDLEFYGERRADWRPYRPDDVEPLADRAQAVAADHLFLSKVIDNVEGITELLDRADADDELVVMLVDAWTACLAPYREALAEIDRRSSPATGVVVPISASDSETHRARRSLDAALSRLFALRSARWDPLLRIGANSAEDFDDDLGAVLEIARNLTLRSATVRRTAPGGPAGARPLLDAP